MSLYDNYRKCDTFECVRLPSPRLAEGTLFSNLQAVNLVSTMSDEEKEALVMTRDGIPIKCIRWDATNNRPVMWCETGQLEDIHLSEEHGFVRAHDRLRDQVHDLLGEMPIHTKDVSLSLFSEESRIWELKLGDELSLWCRAQRALVRYFRGLGHPLGFEGIATGELHFPRGISWISGDGVTVYRADSWRSEVQLTHVLRALVLLRAGLREAGCYLFFHTKDAVEQVSYESIEGGVNTQFRGSWDAALALSQRHFAAAFGCLDELKVLQAGWKPLVGPEMPPCEMRPAYADGLQSLALALSMRCSYLRHEVWPATVRAVMHYRERSEAMMHFGPEAEAEAASSDPASVYGAAFASFTAMDKDIWTELERPEVNLRCLGLMAVCESVAGAAVFHLDRAYLPEEHMMAMRSLAHSLHSLHRGALLHHLGAVFAGDTQMANELMAVGLVSEDIFAVLKNISAAALSVAIEREMTDATSSESSAAAAAGPEAKKEDAEADAVLEKRARSKRLTADLEDPTYSKSMLRSGMLPHEFVIRCSHLALLHFTQAMRESLVRGVPIEHWKELLRGEVVSFYIKLCSRFEHQAYTELTATRDLSDPEHELLLLRSTISMGALWQNIIMGCLVNEMLLQKFGVRSARDWSLVRDKDAFHTAADSTSPVQVDDTGSVPQVQRKGGASSRPSADVYLRDLVAALGDSLSLQSSNPTGQTVDPKKHSPPPVSRTPVRVYSDDDFN